MTSAEPSAGELAIDIGHKISFVAKLGSFGCKLISDVGESLVSMGTEYLMLEASREENVGERDDQEQTD